jgi:competence protein ComEA
VPSNRSRRADRARRRLGLLLGEPAASSAAVSPGPEDAPSAPPLPLEVGAASTVAYPDEPVRWLPTNLRGLWLLFGVALLLAGSWWLLSRPRGTPIEVTTAIPTGAAALTTSPTAPPVPTASGSASAAATSQVVVDVEGKVRHPGIVALPAGSRVVDALRAAGLRPGVATTALNLARVLVDGEQLWVGRRPPATAVGPTSSSGGTSSAATGPVNLNTATLEQLDALPGIGPVLAQRILDWRSAHGTFTSIDQLKDVSGIGDATFADLENLVTV